MTNTRSTRESESIRSSREREMRDHTMLPEYNMGYVSPLALPHGVAREGHTYYWAERNFTTEVEQLYSKHWTLVPSDRCPHYTGDPLGRNPYAAKYLCYKDLILMERPEVFAQQEKRLFYLKNQEVMNSLKDGSNGLKVKDDYLNTYATPYHATPSHSMTYRSMDSF